MTNSASSKPQNYTSLAAIRSQSVPTQLVDILMTNVWPSSIAQYSSVPLPSPDLSANGAPHLDEVIRNIKPRYHFAAKGGQPPVFWEREPYTWDRDSGRVSRFVSLGAFGGEVTTGKKPRVCLTLSQLFSGIDNSISGFMRSQYRLFPLMPPTLRNLQTPQKIPSQSTFLSRVLSVR